MNIAAINNYIGVPYELGGRGMAGADCYGLLMLIYWNELDVLLPEFGDVTQISEYKVIPQPKDFCIVRTRRGVADHVGLYIAGNVLVAEPPSSRLVPLEVYKNNSGIK